MKESFEVLTTESVDKFLKLKPEKMKDDKESRALN